MEDFHIRGAVREDASQFVSLLKQLGYPTTLPDFERRFEKFIACEGFGVAVACQLNKIVGWIAWSKTPFFLSDKTRFHIEGLVVDYHYRRLGVGKKLLNFLEVVAKKNQPAVIDLTSNIRRAKEGVHDFYQSLGYVNEGLTEKRYFRKEI